MAQVLEGALKELRSTASAAACMVGEGEAGRAAGVER